MKKLLRRWASLPLRAWRSKGFGVHSPYAFSFITTVLPDRNSYYDYTDIGSDRQARRLYRILLSLAPASIVCSGPLNEAATTAVSKARAAIASSPASPKAVIVSPGSIVGISYLRRILADGGSVIFTDLRDSLSAEILNDIAACGMTFAGLRMAIINGSATLPRQLFPLLI